MLTRQEVVERGIEFSYGGVDNRPDVPFEIIAYDKIGRRKAVIDLDEERCKRLIELLNEHLGIKHE